MKRSRLSGNVLLSFPVMVLYIVIISYLGAGGLNIVLAVTFASAPGIMRIVRALTLDLKHRDYVAAAQTRGESSLYIMFVEILLNARGPLMVDVCCAARLYHHHHCDVGISWLGPATTGPGLGQDDCGDAAARQFCRAHGGWCRRWRFSSLVLGFNLLADGLRESTLDA